MLEGTRGRVSSGNLVPAAVLVLTVIGIIIRLSSFRDSLFADEISTYYIVHGHSLSRVLQLVHSNQEVSPPLYFISAWLTRGILSSGQESIRIPSMVAGIAAIPLTYLLGAWTVGKRAALIAAAIVTFAPFLIFYSSQARPYMLMTTLALCSTLCLLRALDRERIGWWVGYALFSCAAAYTHYTVFYLLVAQLVWAFWTRPEARIKLVVANIAALLLYIPWIGGFRADLHGPNSISGFISFGLPAIRSEMLQWWLGNPLSSIAKVPGRTWEWLAGLALVIAAVSAVARAIVTRSRRDQRARLSRSWSGPSTRPVLVVVLAFATAAGVALQSAIGADVWSAQNLIASWPALAVLVGLILYSAPRPIRLVCTGVVLVTFVLSGVHLANSPQLHRSDVTAVAVYLEHHESPGDTIVNLPFFGNPLSELDTALTDTGQPVYVPGNYEDHALSVIGDHVNYIRLGLPTLTLQFKALAGPHGQPLKWFVPAVPGSVVAAEATQLTGSHTLYLVTPGSTTDLRFRRSNDQNYPAAQFVDSLPPQWHILKKLTYPGFLQWTMYIIRQTG